MCLFSSHPSGALEEWVRQPKVDSFSLCAGRAAGIHRCVLCFQTFWKSSLENQLVMRSGGGEERGGGRLGWRGDGVRSS